jgi:hypothetical protein
MTNDGFVAFAVHEPRCPNPACGRTYLAVRKPFPAGDEAQVRCDYCGETSGTPQWFDYDQPDDRVARMAD